MIEPQPLGWENVKFCFACLGFGFCVALIVVCLEFLQKRCSQKRSKPNRKHVRRAPGVEARSQRRPTAASAAKEAANLQKGVADRREREAGEAGHGEGRVPSVHEKIRKWPIRLKVIVGEEKVKDMS